MVNFEKLIKIFESEPNLIELNSSIDSIFVGDTHGDIDASRNVIEKYPLEQNQVIFLGDYVDRGKQSKENIDYLLDMKEKHPHNLVLLMGNHEFAKIPFLPRDFWDQLPFKERELYQNLLEKLPLAVSVDKIIGLHGALPDANANINKIPKTENNDIYAMIWGDFIEEHGGSFGENEDGRPKFGSDWFNDGMNAFGKNVLIRGHDYHVPEKMYDDRCLTIFTTNAYNNSKRTIKRRIAILKAGVEAKTANDLVIERI